MRKDSFVFSGKVLMKSLGEYCQAFEGMIDEKTLKDSVKT